MPLLGSLRHYLQIDRRGPTPQHTTLHSAKRHVMIPLGEPHGRQILGWAPSAEATVRARTLCEFVIDRVAAGNLSRRSNHVSRAASGLSRVIPDPRS